MPKYNGTERCIKALQDILTVPGRFLHAISLWGKALDAMAFLLRDIA